MINKQFFWKIYWKSPKRLCMHIEMKIRKNNEKLTINLVHIGYQNLKLYLYEEIF